MPQRLRATRSRASSPLPICASAPAPPWFRPEGFFIASEVDDDSAIAAFTWTKIPTGQEQGKLSPLRREFYVVGVNPQAQGCGLGRTLTLRALAYLACAEDENGEPAARH